MSSLLSVPVSVVDASWIASELYPSLNRALDGLLEGGVLWIGSDSCREGNYLLQRVRVFAQERKISYESMQVSEHDPYLFWDDVVGVGDEPASLWQLAPRTIVCVENGYAIPARLVRDRHRVLDAYARAHRIILVIPISHSIRRDLESAPFIGPPPFNDVPDGRRRELAVALLADAFPGDHVDRRSSRARDLIGAKPVSRVELESWVDYFADMDADGAQPWRVPPPVARHPLGPADYPTRQELRARLTASMARLREASVAFNTWRGQALIRDIRQPPDPFDARDPIHWFSGTVSFLACYLFDAVDDGFIPLLGWRWNDGSREIEAAEPLPFLETLRALRTVMQHGLDDVHPRNRDTLAEVEQWCRAVSGSPTPQRDHCRALTSRLLRELEEASSRLNTVVVHAADSSNRDLIEAQLELAMRRLPKYRWRELLEEASAGWNVDIDLDRVLERHLPKLQKDIQETPEKVGALADRARQLASEVILVELARCPVTGEDLIAAGLPRGPLLGQAKGFVEERWRTDTTLTKDLLIALARERFLATTQPQTSAVREAPEAKPHEGLPSAKRSKWWLWILIALSLVIAGIFAVRFLN